MSDRTIEANRDDLAAVAAGNGRATGEDGASPKYAPTWKENKSSRTNTTTKKLVLAKPPVVEDTAGHHQWLTETFGLDPRHPITSVHRSGVRGPNGHVELRRRGVPALRFEPASRIMSGPKLAETLAFQTIPTDAETPGFKAEHTRTIAHVVTMAADATQAVTEAQETTGIIGAFLLEAEAVEGHTTHGDEADTYSAATELRRVPDQYGRLGPNRYLIDKDTGEYVISVADLAAAARRQIGSVPHGWLDARMSTLGWARLTLDAHEAKGRVGRLGPHACIGVYRGHLQGGHGEDR
jgi:hypothetical protein